MKLAIEYNEGLSAQCCICTNPVQPHYKVPVLKDWRGIRGPVCAECLRAGPHGAAKRARQRLALMELAVESCKRHHKPYRSLAYQTRKRSRLAVRLENSTDAAAWQAIRRKLNPEVNLVEHAQHDPRAEARQHP